MILRNKTRLIWEDTNKVERILVVIEDEVINLGTFLTDFVDFFIIWSVWDQVPKGDKFTRFSEPLFDYTKKHTVN